MNIGLNVNLVSTFDRYLYRELVQKIQSRGWTVDHRFGLLYPPDKLHEKAVDAYVTWVMNRALWKRLQDSPVPVVNFTYVLSTPDLYQVTHDQRKVGAMAAEYLMDLGRRTILLLGQHAAYSLERIEGFQSKWTLHRGSAPAEVVEDHTQLPQVLHRWLEVRPFPDALFCTSDELALYAIKYLETRGLRIPQDVAVVGVGHEEIHSLCLGREITSVVTDHLSLASRILEVLDWIEADPSTFKQPERVPPQEVYSGETSCRVLPEDPGLRAAGELLVGDSLRDLNLDRLAAEAAMSRRNFERKFKQDTGISPGQAIREARMSLAKRLLVDSRVSIETVAEECGYADRYHFSVRFKKDTGHTPAAYRKRIQRLQG